jgi:hypothetical protein
MKEKIKKNEEETDIDNNDDLSNGLVLSFRICAPIID